MISFNMKQKDAQPTMEASQSTKVPQACLFSALEIHAKFQHYRSENYAQAVQSTSCTSVKSETCNRELSPLKSNPPEERTMHMTSFSQSVPSSPKQAHISQKSSTLPSAYVSNVHCSDSCSSSIANFLKRLSPKFHKNWSGTKTKPWIVIEFAQSDLDGNRLGNESYNCSQLSSVRKNISNSSRNIDKFEVQQNRTIHEAKSDSDSIYISDQATNKIHNKHSVSLHAVTSKSAQLKGGMSKSKSVNSYKSKIALTKNSFLSKLSGKKIYKETKSENNQISNANLTKQENTSKNQLDIPAVEVHAPKDCTDNLYQAETSTDYGKGYCMKIGKLLDLDVEHLVNPVFSDVGSLQRIKLMDFNSCVREDLVCLKNVVKDLPYNHSAFKPLSMISLKDEAIKQGHSVPHKVHSRTTETTLLAVPEASIHPRKAQPPQTLSLHSKIFVHSPQTDRVAYKMASVESIGSCSLDVDGSESSYASDMKDELTVSEKTLKSCSAILSSCSSPNDVEVLSESNGILSREKKSSSDGSATQLSKKHDPEEKQECTIAEIKLPSYVSISCAINGYTNYGRFCRSRDNSPARFSSSPMKSWETADSPRSHNSGLSMAGRTAESNGKFCYKESKEMLIGKKLEIPLVNGSSTQISSNVDRTFGKSFDVTDRAVNGHTEEKGILLETLQEIGGASSKHKSLVMQRIESLYGHTSEVCKIQHRNSRMVETMDKNSYSMKRSPSCPPQATRNQSRSPPVFRHLAKDFREQLRENDSLPQTSAKNGKELADVSGLSNNSSSTIKSSLVSKPNLSQLPSSLLSPKEEFEKDGQHFLLLMEIEKCTIGQQISELEKYLDDTNIPEDVCGKIRSAIGKASLLLSQKFEQFRKLCEKNISKNGEPIPTSSDLEGFWDLVLLQVTDVKNTFSEINRIKENNWQEIISPKKVPTRPKFRKRIPPGISISNPSTPSRSSKSSELSKAREEARKQLLEAKRKGRQQNAAQEAEIAIFVPPHSTNGH